MARKSGSRADDAAKTTPDAEADVGAARSNRGGRRAGESGTRDAVLRAARESFAQQGYAHTTIRAVAGAAHVDPALVLHFFGSKDTLFATCLAFPPDITEKVSRILAVTDDTVGERLTRFYFELWDEPETGEPLRAVFRSIAANDDAARMAKEFISSHLIVRAAESYRHDHAERRVTLAFGQMVGVMYARNVMDVAPLVAMSTDDLVQHVAPSVQRYLTEELP